MYRTEIEIKKNITGDALNKLRQLAEKAFSNRAGVHIFLGISDDGLITGVLPGAVEKLKKDFVTAVNNANKLYPPLYLSLEEIQIDELLEMD